MAATTVRSSSPHPSKPVKNDSQDKPDKPEKPEKEKKKKEVSSSRQKRFHRHFQQVAEDEKVINCKYIERPPSVCLFFKLDFKTRQTFDNF